MHDHWLIRNGGGIVFLFLALVVSLHISGDPGLSCSLYARLLADLSERVDGDHFEELELVLRVIFRRGAAFSHFAKIN